MWIKSNPNLGKTVSYEAYQLDVERAEKAPASRNDILAKRFGLPMEGFTYYFTYEETLPHRRRDYWQMPCAMGETFHRATTSVRLRFSAFSVSSRVTFSESSAKNIPPYLQVLIQAKFPPHRLRLPRLLKRPLRRYFSKCVCRVPNRIYPVQNGQVFKQ